MLITDLILQTASNKRQKQRISVISKLAKKILYSFSILSLCGIASMAPVAVKSVYAESWINCAKEEGDECHIRDLTKLVTIKYSADEGDPGMAKLLFVSGVEKVDCTEEVFGDGSPNYDDQCSYVYHNPIGIDIDVNWQNLGSEGATFYLPTSAALYILRYGRDGAYTYQFAEPGSRVICNDYRFGFDPKSGTKSCAYYALAFEDSNLAHSDDYFYEPTTGYEYGRYNDCATQDNYCDTQTDLPVLIRFGSDNTNLSVTHVGIGNQVWCDNRFFNYAVDDYNWKYCDIRKLVPAIGYDQGVLIGDWQPYTSLQKDEHIENTWSFQSRIGSSKTISEASTVELSNKIGAEFEISGKINGTGTTASYSFERSWGTSETFTEAFQQGVTAVETVTCTVDREQNLYVWEFNISGQAERCELGTGSECSILAHTGYYACTSVNQKPSCGPTDFECIESASSYIRIVGK